MFSSSSDGDNDEGTSEDSVLLQRMRTSYLIISTFYLIISSFSFDIYDLPLGFKKKNVLVETGFHSYVICATYINVFCNANLPVFMTFIHLGLLEQICILFIFGL